MKELKLPYNFDFVTCGNKKPGVHIFHHWGNRVLCDEGRRSCFLYTRHKDSPPVCKICLEKLKESNK